jgi:hypothetical protein
MFDRLPRSFAFTFAVSAVLALSANAQAPHPLTSADRQRIDEIVHKMTLAEKLDYIGGEDMTIRAVPSVGVHSRRRMGRWAFGWTPAFLRRPMQAG